MIEPFVSPDWRGATTIINYLSSNLPSEPGMTPEDVLQARIAELKVNKYFPIARAMLFAISLGSQISKPEPPEIV